MNDALATPLDASPQQTKVEREGVVARRADIIAVASLALMATLFFGDVWLGINNFYMRDLTRYYYPT